MDQSYELLTRLPEIRKGLLEGIPLLVGPSRKSFIGTLIGQPEANKRTWGTAASCVVSVAGGASIIRIHDVKEMRDVLIVADRCYKNYEK